MASDADLLGGSHQMMGPHCQGPCRPPGMVAHLSEHPEAYTGLFLLVALGACIVAGILGGYASKIFTLSFESPSAIVRYTLCAAMTPLIFVVAKVLAVLVPRWWGLTFFISSCYESAAVFAILQLVCTYLGGPNQDLQALEKGSPIKVWALAPSCCFCLGKRAFDGLDLLVVNALVLQRVASAPLVALMDMSQDASSRQTGLLEVGSQFLALYALLVLLNAGEATKERHSATLRTKVWTFMCILIVNTLVFRAMAAGFPHFAEDGCLHAGGGCYRPIDVAAARAAAATAALLAPLAVFLRQAFPLAELLRGGATQEAAGWAGEGPAFVAD